MEFRRPNKRFKKTPFCYFAVPDDDTTHTKIEVNFITFLFFENLVSGILNRRDVLEAKDGGCLCSIQAVATLRQK